MNCENCFVLQENILLRAENEELKKQNERLKHQLTVYKDASSRKREEKFLSRRRRERTEILYPGRPKVYPGTTRPIPEPDQIVEAEELDDCPECGSFLGPPFRVRRRIVEDFPDLQPMMAIEFEEKHYRCPGCRSLVISRHRDCPPEGRMGRNVCVQTTLMKFEQRLPERKIKSVLERQGLTITPATVLDI